MKKQTKNSFKGAGRVAFLAQPRKDRIQKMVDEGYPLTVIYEKYKNELNISYEQFTRHARKHLRSKPHENEGRETKPGQQDNSQTAISPKPIIYDEESEDSIIFDEEHIKRKANEEDLF